VLKPICSTSAFIPFAPGVKPRPTVTFELLADNPALGRPCDEIRSGLRRMKQGKHVVFYREEPGGILISRILHQRMLPENQAIEDQDDTQDQRSAITGSPASIPWGLNRQRSPPPAPMQS
jgi:ParE toxin of type II toxin-antitoxin system, parDE